MILQKWNKALIDWVNCLSLTGQITIIEELKSGEFFRLLLKKFTSSAALTECTSDSFDDIYNLLEKEFPLYGVREIERDEFKLSYIASLLLLLSVTKEETPMFQSNLCEKLPHDSQVKIKCFLESCLETTNELNHSYLKTILEGDVVSHCQNSTKVKDNVSFKTPMKDFFDSPRQTNKLKRDLKRLEEENESLLLEKLELEDELRSVKENKQQIEEALLQKNEQVLKLREELQDFIHNSNANLVENDVSSQSLSAIKSELRDLEIYVAELQEEKTALIEEKEKLQEKLTALQCKNKDLEFQTEYSENKQQELLAMLHKRDEEVFSLRERCSELEEKINAIQPAHNISIESDSSIPIGIISSPYAGERLSQAVVDVKLQEVEEENERFKDQVKMLTDQRNNLTNQIKEVKEDLAKERREFRDCTAKLESLMIELGELKDSIVSKENSLRQFETNLKEKEGLIKSLETVLETETSEKKQLVSDILSLQNNIKLLEETKEEILMENSNFKIQILQLSGKLSALEMSLELKEKNILNMKEELASRSVLADNLRLEITKYEEELSIMKEENYCMKETISLKQRECSEMKEEMINKDNLITEIKNDALTKERVIEEIREELRKKNNVLHSLESAHKALEEDAKLIKRELEQKIVQLQEKESIAAKDQQEIIECREEIDKLLVELNVVNQNCVLKDNTLHELNQELSECKDKIKTLEETKLSFLSEKKELESKIHSLLDNIKHMEETKEGIVMENSQYKDQISLCEQEITDLKTSVEEKEAKLVVLDDELSSKCMLYEGLQKKLNKCQDEIESLNQEKCCLADRISAKEKECEQFKEEVASRNILIAKLESNALTMGRSMEEMRIELSNKTQSLQAVQSAQEVLESEKQVLIGELEQTKCLVSEKENIAREAEQEILEYEDKLKKLNSEMENFKYKLHESNDRNKSCVETMLIEKKELESSILSLRAYVKLTEETKEEILKENSHYKNQVLDYVSKITELETKLEDKEGKIVTLNNELSSKCNLLEQIEENFKKCQVGMESLEKERSSLADRITLKEKECEELMEKMDNKDCVVAKFENDNLTKEKIITELREKLTEKTNLVKKFESIQQALEAEKFQLNTELEQMKTFVSEKESIFEMANQEILEHLDRIEKLNLEIKDIKDQLCGSHDKIRVLEDREMAVVKERDILQSNLLSLKSNVKCLEESKAEILNENSVYKNQVLEFEGKISNLQSKLDEKERKIIFLAEEVSLKNCLIESKEVMIKECQDEIEIMKKEKSYTEENSILSEKREKELERKISKMEATINSLEATNECLMSEKKETLLLVNEQRITIEVLQQKLDSLNEEKMILDDKICWWKEQCVAFEKMLEELKLQDSSNKVGLGNVDDSIKSFGNKENTVNELEHVSLSKNDEHKAIVSNLEDSTNQSSHEYRDKDGHLDESDVNSENIEFCLEKAVEEEKLKQLDVEKIMLLVSSWHDIDEKLENLRGIEHRLKIKIGSLWESIPKIQSKLKEKSDMDSAQSSIQETGNRKEVIMRIISMVRSLEKNFSSLEKELVQASTNAVSWGLQGIQNQFNVVTNIPNSDNGNIDLNSKNEQRNAFSSYLDILKDKVSQALEDVNSSVDIFREVECRSENVTEVLEYLKKNCLYEQELLCDFDYEGFQITLTEEETRKRFVKAMDEMEKAKENLERITCESQKEVERLQNEKESLVKDLQSVTSRCSLLESKLEMSEKQVELAVRETQQRIQKIFEKKLETTKEKLKSLYMDDLKKYEEECKLRKQFEESFKKYRSLTENYEKRLAEANAKNDDLRSKVQNLQHQKSCIEIKLRESMAKNFIEDDRRDSLDSGVYRSNYVDAMANYFARNNTSSPSHSFFDSQRDTNHDSISRTFSRESVQSSLPSGKVFCAEDEEGELFNATYLNDLNEGKCIVPSNRASKVEACSGILRESNKQSIRNPAFDEESPNRRMKELMRRNTLCLPHLKSSYPTETQFHDPKNFPEELLKGGEQGSEQGKIPSTPGRFRSWFARGKKTAPNDVENIPCTPRTKQKGLFQRAIANLERDGS